MSRLPLVADHDAAVGRQRSSEVVAHGPSVPPTVVVGAAIAGEDVLDVRARRVGTSLVVAEIDHPDTVRYRLLERTRTDGGEWLHTKGERATLALAHARFFLALAQQAGSGRVPRRTDMRAAG